jgi:Mycoplasma protein of unknown function, DUF285
MDPNHAPYSLPSGDLANAKNTPRSFAVATTAAAAAAAVAPTGGTLPDYKDQVRTRANRGHHPSVGAHFQSTRTADIPVVFNQNSGPDYKETFGNTPSTGTLVQTTGAKTSHVLVPNDTLGGSQKRLMLSDFSDQDGPPVGHGNVHRGQLPVCKDQTNPGGDTNVILPPAGHGNVHRAPLPVYKDQAANRGGDTDENSQGNRLFSNLSVRREDRHAAHNERSHLDALGAIAVSDDEVDEARARVIREAREAFLAEAGHAEPVDPVVVSPHSRSWKRSVLYWGLALCLVVATIVGVAVGVSNQQSNLPKAGAPVERVTLAPTSEAPTATPIIVLEDGRIAFSTTMQLYEAVDAYLSEVDNGGFSNTSEVAVLHGYPIGNWDVFRITNFDRVFDADRSLTLDPEWNPTRRTSFDSDLGGWDTSNAVSMRGMFAASDEFVGH